MDFNTTQSKETKRQLYFAGILNETLPSENITTAILKTLELPQSSGYQILHFQLDLNFQKAIDKLDMKKITHWKQQLQNDLSSVVSQTDYKLLGCLNMQPFTRTLILSFPLDCDEEKLYEQLSTRFYKLVNYIKDCYKAGITGSLGNPSTSLLGISPSYKNARKLTEYHFATGLNHLIRYTDIPKQPTNTLVEYKYLQYYQEYLDQQDLDHILSTIQNLQEILSTSYVPNSRSKHLFKEIISITIKYLYRKNEHFEILEKLNEGITHFEYLFNDMYEVSNWLCDILPGIFPNHITTSAIGHPYLNRMLNVIERDYHKDISLSEIAEILHVTTPYLSRLFKENHNINFKEYLTNYRLNKAKELLTQTNLTIKIIGERVGYPNPVSFNRVFKKHEGITPREYRCLH